LNSPNRRYDLNYAPTQWQPIHAIKSRLTPEAGAPEIEITPAMIEAGDDILLRELIWLEDCSEKNRHDVIRRLLLAALIQR
jgi:hypothetical protein